MHRPHRILVAVLAAAAVAVPVSMAAPAQADAQVGSPARAAPAVAVTGTNSPFSPNADGSKDRGAVAYRLAGRAYVTVRITTGNTAVLTTKPEHMAKGNHTFVWDGKHAGTVVSDGTYAITVLSRATKRGHARAASTRMVVDARYGSLGIGYDRPLSSTSVYPRTTVIHDEVVGTISLPTGYDAGTIRREVLTPHGRLVDSAPLDPCSTGCSNGGNTRRYNWDGRDSQGAIVPVDTYYIRLVQGRDRAGNPRLLLPPRTVTVSGQHLVAKTTNLSATAQALTRRDACYHGPNDCLIRPGRTSARFPGGLSYVSEQTTFYGSTFYDSAYDQYVLPITGRSTPYDTFTVTAHGGPSTAGDDDTGTLYAGSRQVLQGDTVATGPKAPSLGMTDPYEAGDGFPGPVLRWGFGTGDGNSYDVAFFDVSYTRYVLP